MQTFFKILSKAVIKQPVLVLVCVLTLTAVFGAFATQSVTVQEMATDDNELTRALGTIDEVFGTPQSVLQVVIESEGDIRSAKALETLNSIESAILNSQASDTLIESGQQPPIISFLSGVSRAAESAGLDPASIDDNTVADLRLQVLEESPAQFQGLLAGLLGSGDPPGTGLMLVFQDTSGLDSMQVIDQQREMADVIKTAKPADGITLTPFSFGLMLTDSDPGPEIGMLFATALGIILLVLATVYWLKPEPGRKRVIIRRTAADVGLTLMVILAAVVWMQGIGVLLGPDYLNLIDYFSPQTQIVPILIVGLGVDFGIHLLARYRFETGSSGDPEKALRIAMGTAGFALLLATGATAIGFLTNLFSPVSFLATLGVLAAVGISAAFLLTATMLPAARIILDRRAARKGTLPLKELSSQTQRALPTIAGKTAWLAKKAPFATVTVALILAGLGGYGFTQLESEFNLTDFVPGNEPVLETFNTLTEQFDGGFEERTQVLITGNIAAPQSHNALIRAIEEIKNIPGVQVIGDFADANSIASVIGQSYAAGLGDQLAELGIGHGFKVEDGTDVRAIYDFLINNAPGAGQVLALDQGSYLTRVDIRTTAGSNRLESLVDGLDQAFEPVEASGNTVVITSQEIAQARQSVDIEDSQILSLLIALGGAMLLLVAYYTIYSRRPLIGVITVMPVGLVLALTFGAMAATGIPINPVTATLAALSIGIGVPFNIHVSSRFLEERASNPNCRLALERTVSQTGGALVGSAITTAVGFGVLVMSTLIPFQQLGFVIVYAIVFSLIAAILVLPSLLVIWDAIDRRIHGAPGSSTPGTEKDIKGCI